MFITPVSVAVKHLNRYLYPAWPVLLACCVGLLPAKKAAGQEFPGISIMLPESMPVIPDTVPLTERIREATVLTGRRPDLAIHALKRILQESEREGYIPGVVLSLKALAETYINTGQTDSSYLLSQQALLRYTASRFQEVLPTVYNILGNVSRIRNEYAQACAYYFRALSASEQLGTDNADAICNNIGSIFLILNQHEEALSYLESAAALARQHGHTEILGYALLNTGVVYNKMGEWELSRGCLDSARAIAAAGGFSRMRHLALTHTGGLYLEQQRPEEALYYLAAADSIRAAVSPDQLVFNKLLTGEAYYARERPAQAIPILLGALRLAEAHRLNELPVRALLSKAYKLQGNYREALVHYEAYKQLSDTMTGRDVAAQINRLNISYNTARKDKMLLEHQLLISTQEHQLRNQRLWIAGISAFTVLLCLCLWALYRSYRHRKQLAEKGAEIRQLKAAILGEERERSRIARELHDGIVSQLMAIRLGIRHLTDGGSMILPEALEEVHSQVKDAAEDLRRTAHNLAPEGVQDQGLAVAVALLCERTEKSSGLEITLEIFDDIPRYDTDMELSSYRIIQELVQNVLKHAQADSLLVQLSCREQTLHITIEDDGTGIPEHRLHSGHGLNNIRNRVSALQGTIHFEYPPEGGTSVYIEHQIRTSNPDIAYAC